MEANPLEEIERLKKIIKKKDCLLALRRKQKREMNKQLDWVYRQSMAIVKNIHGQK